MVRRSLRSLVFLGMIISCPTVATRLLADPTTSAKVDLTPGKYDFTVTYEIQGERAARPMTATRCITPEALDSPEEIFTDSAVDKHKSNAPCKVENLKDAGEKISYDADCSNRLVHVEGTVSRTEFLVVRNVKPKASKGVSLKLVLRGKRTGDCRVQGKATKH